MSIALEIEQNDSLSLSIGQRSIGGGVTSVNGKIGTVVTLTSGTTDEVTPAQVWAAIEAGDNVSISYTDSTYGELIFTDFVKGTGFGAIISTTLALYGDTWLAVTLAGNIESGTWLFSTAFMARMADIPAQVYETWTFTLDDNTTVTKNVVIST